MIKQRTIKKTVKARGIGIHSGGMVNMTLIPALECRQIAPKK